MNIHTGITFVKVHSIFTISYVKKKCSFPVFWITYRISKHLHKPCLSKALIRMVVENQ